MSKEQALGFCDNPGRRHSWPHWNSSSCVNWREQQEPPDPYRTHLDTKEADQRRQLQARLHNRTAHIDPADIGAPHLKEEREQPAQGEPSRRHEEWCCLDLDHKGDCKRWMKLPPNPAYPNFKEIHVQDDWCPKAGCVPATKCDIDYHHQASAPSQPSAGEKPRCALCKNVGTNCHAECDNEDHHVDCECLKAIMCAVEPSSPPATAGTLEKYFVDKTDDGWGIFYNEPNAPETGRACIGGSADEHIARLRCQILNSHIADVLDAVGFAKTQERLTGRCLCVGAWKSGCPVHDNSPAPAGTAREFYIARNKGVLPSQAAWTANGAMRFAEAYAGERVRQEREARERAEGALRTLATKLRAESFLIHDDTGDNPEQRVVDLEEALAALKSSQEEGKL